MKKLNAVLLAAALMAGAGLCAETFVLDKPADWKISGGSIKWVGDKQDVMEIKGSVMLTSTREFPVDVNKIYEMEAYAKLISAVSGPCYLGFTIFDKDGRQIPAYAVNACSGTETTLAREVKVGDKTILVKAHPKWTNGPWFSVIRDVKSDLSDLPNYNFVGDVTGMQPNGENVEVTLMH